MSDHSRDEVPTNHPETSGVEEAAELVYNNTVENTRQYFPLINEADNPNYMVFLEDLETVGFTNDLLHSLLNQQGEAIYNNRFDGALIGTTLMGHDLDQYTVSSENNDFYLGVIKFLGQNPAKLEALRGRWQQQVQNTGVITPPTFLITNGSLEKQHEDFMTHGWDVDVYSSPKRPYTPLQEFIRTHGYTGGTLLDVGTAAGDFPLAMKSDFELAIGIDKLPLEETVRTAMMRNYRFKSDAEIEDYLEQVKAAGVSIKKCDMFDEHKIHELLKDAPRPLVVVGINSLFPHFHSDYVRKGSKILASLKPDLLAIGGVVPALEMQHKDGNWVSKRVTPLFNLSGNEPKLIDTIIV